MNYNFLSLMSIFETSTRQELLERINSLEATSLAQLGKRNVAQMIRHCAKWDEMVLGKVNYKQSVSGRFVGKFALKGMMKDDPIKKDLPTMPSLKMAEAANFFEEKRNWIALIKEYEHSANEGFIHPFFGKLTNGIAG